MQIIVMYYTEYIDFRCRDLDYSRLLKSGEMWIWRKVVKICWKEKIANGVVLGKVQEGKRLLTTT